jgi:hypothetical protein
MARQFGLQREATRTPPSWAKSQYGEPPTASIPKTRDQPEEPNSKRSRPCGNNASTGISRVPPIRQQMREPTSDRQHAPHLDAGTTTGSAHTKNPIGVRAGRPRPADSRTGGTLPNLALQIKRPRCVRPLRACPRITTRRALAIASHAVGVFESLSDRIAARRTAHSRESGVLASVAYVAVRTARPVSLRQWIDPPWPHLFSGAVWRF